MPVTNPPIPPAPDPQSEADQLYSTVTRLVAAAFKGDVVLITTDRTGRVDAAFTSEDLDGGAELVPADYEGWLAGATDDNRDFTLRSLGGTVRLYVTHPDRSPLTTVRTYDNWPAMVELSLP